MVAVIELTSSRLSSSSLGSSTSSAMLDSAAEDISDSTSMEAGQFR